MRFLEGESSKLQIMPAPPDTKARYDLTHGIGKLQAKWSNQIYPTHQSEMRSRKSLRNDFRAVPGEEEDVLPPSSNLIVRAT